MKAVLQRVSRASVTVDGDCIASVNKGYLILFGVEKDDNYEKAEKLALKISLFRCFNDENDKMNLSIKDVNGEILAVSQFTLCASLKKGNRPGFDNAKNPKEANDIYEFFVKKLEEQGITVKKGIFGADMKVELLNDGPVTFVFDDSSI